MLHICMDECLAEVWDIIVVRCGTDTLPETGCIKPAGQANVKYNCLKG